MKGSRLPAKGMIFALWHDREQQTLQTFAFSNPVSRAPFSND